MQNTGQIIICDAQNGNITIYPGKVEERHQKLWIRFALKS